MGGLPPVTVICFNDLHFAVLAEVERCDVTIASVGFELGWTLMPKVQILYPKLLPMHVPALLTESPRLL